MSWLGRLKIHTKFNLITSSLLILLFITAAFLTYQWQRSLILKVAIDNARIFSKQIIETRDYMSEVVKGEPDSNYALVPQVVATEVAKRMTRDTPYYVRQVSLRYRNPGNRPDAFEAEQLKKFASGPAHEASTIITTKGKETFRYLLPMVASASCLECHGEYDKAPRFIRERFPRGHFSYNYKVGEVIGAVSVSIPMVELYHEIGTNLKLDLLIRGIIFLIIIGIMGWLLRRSIIDPVKMLSESIVRVTKTGNFADRLPTRSHDEIGILIASFNELMTELDRKTLQSMESEERYRRLIEILRAAVITFLQNGKIVIANQRAEELLERTKQDLLGESIFDYIVEGELLKAQLEAFLRDHVDAPGSITLKHRVRRFSESPREMDLEVYVSRSDHVPMLTAILREPPK